MNTVQDKFTLDDLKSGYVVKLRSGELRMVMRVGRFTKALIAEDGCWTYLRSCYTEDLLCDIRYPEKFHRTKESMDIIEVYGLIQATSGYPLALKPSTVNRKLLWVRNPTVKMTVSEICEKLGYNIEIVPERR